MKIFINIIKFMNIILLREIITICGVLGLPIIIYILYLKKSESIEDSEETEDKIITNKEEDKKEEIKVNGNTLVENIKLLEKDRNTNFIFVVCNFWGKMKIAKNLKQYIIDIDDDDTFLRRINDLEYDNIDVFLHTNGGDVDSSERMAKFLLNYDDNGNGNVNTNVPEYASSAGTIIALAGKLHMNKYAFLGPTDPQLLYTDDDNDNEKYAPSGILAELVSNKMKKLDIELSADMYVTGRRASCEYNDNIKFTEEILKRKQPKYTQDLLKLFSDGEVPHYKPFDTFLLKSHGLEIHEIDNKLNILFKEFRSFRDLFT